MQFRHVFSLGFLALVASVSAQAKNDTKIPCLPTPAENEACKQKGAQVCSPTDKKCICANFNSVFNECYPPEKFSAPECSTAKSQLESTRSMALNDCRKNGFAIDDHSSGASNHVSMHIFSLGSVFALAYLFF